MRGNRKDIIIKSLILLVSILLSLIWEDTNVQAVENASISISGLKVGDYVEIYRIASYKESEQTYVWEGTVADWIQNKEEGKSYLSLNPNQLDRMTASRALEFFQTLIIGLKNESKGIANLDGYTFFLGEEKEQYKVENIKPGYYVILPKGTDRIYELKWQMIAPGEEAVIHYDMEAGDYQIPSIETVLINKTKDRGKVRDGTLLLLDDELEVTSHIAMPKFSEMYAIGKRILNISIVVPKGLTYKEDSLTLSIEDASAYSVGTYEKATVYRNRNGDVLFFGTPQGYFYELNGSLLLSSGEPEEAMEKYNTTYETDYLLAVQKTATEDHRQSDTEIASSQESEVIEEQNLHAPPEMEVEHLIAEDASKIVTAYDGQTIFVIALDTADVPEEVVVTYAAEKNTAASGTGEYNNLIALSYSVSPLDSNLIYSSISEGLATAYSITVVAAEGSGEYIDWTTEEKLDKAPRFSGVVFTVYRVKGDEEYEYVNTIMTNNQGVASLSGLEAAEYLVEQTVYPTGFTLSDASLLIKKDAWTDESVMEGDEDIMILWLEYKTRYLPVTGKTGTAPYIFNGMMICVMALGTLVRRKYPFGIQASFNKK
ncbi:MAG: hypothetical protein IKW08_08820 [Roseburia sp.]|nr:hypothetical protein [Roseburia sp.]